MKLRRTYITAWVKLDAPCGSSSFPQPIMLQAFTMSQTLLVGSWSGYRCLGMGIGAGHEDAFSQSLALLCLSFSVSKDVRHS